MTPQEYERISNLFHELSVLPALQRLDALEAACRGDSYLRDHVLRMLEADSDADGDGFLKRAGLEDAANDLARDTLALLSAGTVLGNYRLGERVGSGGMGVVYSAEDLPLGRRVALKILPPLSAGLGTERMQRFQREARAAAQLNHPHIAAVYGAGTDKGWSYIAMEFVEGRTLGAIIAGQTALPDARAVLDILAQTASALSAAHEAGIIHRDIKPDNIMLRPDGFVKVLDFGLASVRAAGEAGSVGDSLRSRAGQVMGTLHYLSPEQVTGNQADARSDLFSLGIVAYELATGIRPFAGNSDWEIFNAILHRDPPPPSSIRPELKPEFDHFILRALKKDAALRFQSAAEFRDACLGMTNSSTSSGTIPAVARPAAQIIWTTKRIAAGVLAAILAVAAALLAWPISTPRVTQVVQITRSEAPVLEFVSDGARLYYAAGPSDESVRMFEVSMTGEEPLELPRLAGMFPLDVSPDHSQLLLARLSATSRPGPYEIWIAPVVGTSPRRLGDLAGQFARWSPKGDRILYSDHSSLRLANKDGSAPREIARVNGFIEDGNWSPDGGRIRFTISLPNSRRIWEVDADGAGLHLLLPQWNQPWLEMGTWTPDGKDFLFSAGQTAHDLWLKRESALASLRSALLRREATVNQITNGPLWAFQPQATGDGRRVFFLGSSNVGKLMRLDGQSKQWLPYLGGIDAVQLNYSRDGRWIVFADSSGSLWRSAADGASRIQLTTPPLYARNPRWSPDGQQVVFYAGAVGQPDSIYLVERNGGGVTQLTHHEFGVSEGDGGWSPDGSEIIYFIDSREADHKRYLCVMNLRTKQNRQLANTGHLWSPRWSPDGKNIGALDQHAHLVLYDIGTHGIRPLTGFSVGYPSWSADGKYLYFENTSSTFWYRVRVDNSMVETLQSLGGLKVALNGAGWVGTTPGGSILSTWSLLSSNIYLLNWGVE